MSEKTDVFTCQFVAKMNGDESLSSRLLVAIQVFTSQSIPMYNKEEVALLEVCKLSSSGTAADTPLIFNCLTECFESKRLKNFSGDLGPKVVDSLVEIFQLPQDISEEIRQAALKCAISLFSASYFQRWFACDVSNLCKLMASLFKAASSSSFNEIIKLLSLMLHINKLTLFKDENRAAFLQYAFIPLCKASEVIPDDEYFCLQSRVTDVVSSVVLYNPVFLEEFCLSKKTVKNEDGTLPPSHQFISQLKCVVKSEENSEKIMMSCCKIFLLSSVKATSKAQNVKNTFDVFVTLCYILGCKVVKKKSISWSPLKNWDHNASYKIIGEMVRILDLSDVPLTIDYGSHSLESWFISLVIGTVNINLIRMSSELMAMVERVFRYNPLIIETCSKSIAEVMICNKSEETLPSYVGLMKAALDGVAQIQRLPKFIFTMLSNVKNTLNERSSTIDNLVLDHVLPHALSDHFAETIITSTNSQALAIFQDVLNRFKLDCLNFLQDGNTDASTVIMTEFLCELLKQLLLSAKIADHSVPQDIKNKFTVLLEDLGRILEQIGTCLESDHHDRLLKSFLDVCHAFAAIQLMIDEYEGSPIRPLRKQDFVPFDFTYVHPYLTSQTWKAIGSSITEHNECLALRSLCNLMVQKVEAVSQVEEGLEGPGTLTARRLLSISNPEWLWNEISNLAPLFQANEVLQLIDALINSLGFQQHRWLELIKQDEFCENRRLILALFIQTLNKTVDFVDENGVFFKKVTENISGSNLLEYELSLLITEDTALEEEIQVSIKNIQKIINERLKFEAVDEKKFLDLSFVQVLHALPVHHFSVLSQCCLSLAVLALLIELPPYDARDHMLLDILFRVLNHYSNNIGKLLVSDINPGKLLKFLSSRAANYPSLKPLLKLICKAALYEKKTAKKLIKAVSEPTVNDIWLSSMVVEAINQLKVKKKNENEMEDEEKDEKIDVALVDKKESLTKLILLIAPILEKEAPSLTLLPTFSAVISLQFRMNDDFGAPSIKSKIGEYLALCPSDPEKGVSLVETLISFKSKIEDIEMQKTVALDGWKLLMQNGCQFKLSSRINSIFTSSTDDEFKLITVDLLSQTSKALEKDDEQKLGVLLELWGILVSSMISFSKSKIRQEVLVSLAKYVVPVLERWMSSSNDDSVEPLLKFFTAYSSATSVEMKPAILDTYLVCLQAVPLPQDQPTLLLENLSNAIEALFALYLFRYPLILDRLHVYLPLYKLYLSKLAKVSDPDSDHMDRAVPCSIKLERVAKTLVKRQKDFGRLAQFIVADVLSILAQHRLHSEIKLKYTNIINSFLVLCDEHAISYLTFSLPSSSQELFKTLHSDFKKYHKYVGQI